MMKLPKYYCTHCKRFKKWYQKKTDSVTGDMFCRHCGGDVLYTECRIKRIIDSKFDTNGLDIDIKDFASWCCDNGINFSFMDTDRDTNEKDAFVEDVVRRYQQEEKRAEERGFRTKG